MHCALQSMLWEENMGLFFFFFFLTYFCASVIAMEKWLLAEGAEQADEPIARIQFCSDGWPSEELCENCEFGNTPCSKIWKNMTCNGRFELFCIYPKTTLTTLQGGKK